MSVMRSKKELIQSTVRIGVLCCAGLLLGGLVGLCGDASTQGFVHISMIDNSFSPPLQRLTESAVTERDSDEQLITPARNSSPAPAGHAARSMAANDIRTASFVRNSCLGGYHAAADVKI